jgi:hypothetical protein
MANYGNEAELEVRLVTAPGSPDWREAFLSFDLSQVAAASQITSATSGCSAGCRRRHVDVGLFEPNPQTHAVDRGRRHWDGRRYSGAQWVGDPTVAGLGS